MSSNYKYRILFLAFSFALSSCQKAFVDMLDWKQNESSPAGEITRFNPLNYQVPLSPDNCVHVFYDRTKPVGYEALGTFYATNLLNLLGHFAEFQRHVSPVEDYVKGDIDKCGVNIYLDTNYYTNVPADFIDDFKSTSKQIVWVGSNSWKLGSQFLKDTFGIQYNATQPYTTLDEVNLDADNKPTFFKNVYYKGEKFYKYGDWGKRAPYLTTFFAPFEISKWDYNLTHVLDQTDHRVIAEIEHNFTLERVPWAIQSNHRFVFSEIPFSFMHEADRYFIFADLLFDILKAAPRHNSKPAVIRLEDVHSEVTIDSLQRARQIFNQNNVKAHVSIIPIFNNPSNPQDAYMGLGERPMTMNPDFMVEINAFKNDGHEFIWHGITHQLGTKPNPWETSSGSDYEFWDFSYDVETNHPWPLVGRPVPYETPKSVLDRFKKGADVLNEAQVYPKVWLTPHYHGSSLDNYIFGKLFSWNIGRVVYYTHNMVGLDVDVVDETLYFPNMSAAAWESRYKMLKYLSVDQELRQNGQLFPYEIYGDVYGQRVFPENIGNKNGSLSEQVLNTRSIQQILEDAARNRVLRDVWGSAFFHPYFLDDDYFQPPTNITNNDLNDLIVGLKNLGYTFVSLEAKSDEWKNVRAKKISYR